MNKMKLISLGAIALIFLISTTYLWGKVNYSYNGQNQDFTISPGSGFSQINYKLFKEGIIDDASFFHRYVKFKNKLTNFKAGTYEIKKGMDLNDILNELTEGTPKLTRITIPEGKNLYEIAKILDKKSIVQEKEFIKMAKDQKFVQSFGIKAPSLEGYLYPETYKFAPKSSVKTVLTSMVNLFNDRVKDLDFSKSYLNKHETIILASIVEKETGAAWERPTIAGVYLNRLKRPMRLQADPTTIYGIWESYNGNLRKKHLLQKTPYNTYKINGLPLGPIASPSLEAIKAVINPKKHKYLYFVSKNDGTHIFTPTYKDHLKAVREFQLNRKNREGKSWRDLKKN